MEEQREMRTVIQNVSNYPSCLFFQEIRKRQGVFSSQQDVFLHHPVVGTKEVKFVRTALVFPASAIICKGKVQPYEFIFFSFPFLRHRRPRRGVFLTVPSRRGRTSHVLLYWVIVSNKTIICKGIGKILKKEKKIIQAVY